MDNIRKYNRETLEGGYRVYTAEYEFKVVQAATAMEAIKVSKISEPYKIEKIGIRSRPIIEAIFLKSQL